MTSAERYRAILSNHLPPQAVEPVYHYLDRHRVHFHITRGRRSKLGDYRRPYPGHDYHEISVNGDLNVYLFLWVFLHEAAHLETHLHHPAAAPHGHEWQSEYAHLIVDWHTLFPLDVQPLLLRYASHIPLSRNLLHRIEEQLHRHDPDYTPDEHLTLDHLLATRGDNDSIRFRLKNKPDLLLESIVRRRTRWLCRDVATGRQYTVSAHADVLAEHTCLSNTP